MRACWFPNVLEADTIPNGFSFKCWSRGGKDPLFLVIYLRAGDLRYTWRYDGRSKRWKSAMYVRSSDFSLVRPAWYARLVLACLQMQGPKQKRW